MIRILQNGTLVKHKARNSKEKACVEGTFVLSLGPFPREPGSTQNIPMFKVLFKNTRKVQAKP